MTIVLAYSIIVPSVSILALLIAGVEDILFREVKHEFIWIVMAVIGFVMDILYIAFYNQFGYDEYTDALAQVLLTIVVGFIIGFVLFYVGAWGGADTKALWALSVLTPVYPLQQTLLGYSFLNPIPVIESSIFSILLNSGILAIFYPLVLIIINSITAIRGSLFDEVRGTNSQKIRCFLFGYKKKVTKINADKLHFDFMEEIPIKKFEGLFKGDFTGRLDGCFIGLCKYNLIGDFAGKVFGKILKTIDQPFEDLKIDEILKQAKEILSFKKSFEDDDLEEQPDARLVKYRSTFSKDSKIAINDNEKLIDYNGQFSGELDGYFLGEIDGVFDGTFEGQLLGQLEGDFSGTSKSGKILGKKEYFENDWKIKVRVGLEEDLKMERRQLRTIWQLQTTKKETVWVTPGLPFVFLMLFGYILYLLIGNIALLIFSL
ncbi:MAG: hypothetical protein FK734_13790 [Asgard group archaeon]|nr:hypothetical protein [Asgard group archaeon]